MCCDVRSRSHVDAAARVEGWKGATWRKPRLSYWQIWNMSFGFLGIQFGWGLQMANMSAIYEYLGAKADKIPILWLAAPLTGLLSAADHRPSQRSHLEPARTPASVLPDRARY